MPQLLQRRWQGVVKLLLRFRPAPGVKAGLADKGCGHGLHHPLLQLQQTAARQGGGPVEAYRAVFRPQLAEQGLVQLDFQMKEGAVGGMEAGQGDAAVDQANRVERALLDNAQQQCQLLLVHAAGGRQQQLPGTAGLAVQRPQMGVHQIGAVAGGPQGWLQGFRAQLPPIAGGHFPRAQPGRGPGIAAKAVLAALQQGIAGALQTLVTVPQLQVAVVDIEAGNGHISAPPGAAAGACRRSAGSPAPAFPETAVIDAGRT